MFLKRLSTALCLIMCLQAVVLGTTTGTTATEAENREEISALMAPMDVDFSMSYTSPTCNGDNNGSIIVNVTIGTGPFRIEYKQSGSPSYIMETASTDTNPFPINGLRAGLYDVRVTDLGETLNNTETKTNFEVRQFGALSLGYNIATVNCSNQNGTITLNASNGDLSAYSYTLERSGTTIQPDIAGGNVFTGLAAGTYNARVIDGNGCQETESGLNVTIPQPISPSVFPGTIDCPGGTATITLNNLPADKDSYQIKLNGNVPPVSKSGTSATITNVPAGSNNLTIERPGCTSGVDDFSFSVPAIEDYKQIDFSWDTNPITNSISVDCFGGDTTLTVTLTGGQTGKNVELVLRDRITSIDTPLHSGLPVNASFDFDVEKGEYSLIARIPSCSYETTQHFNIGGPSNPFEITSLEASDVSCPGASDGSIKVNYTGGSGTIEYAYNGGAFSPLPTNNLITGLAENPTYSVQLRDSRGCTTAPMVESIDGPNPINVSLAVTQALTCPGGNDGILTATTTGGGSGGYRYTLRRDGVDVDGFINVSGGATRNFTNLIAGDYEVEVYTLGCSDNRIDQTIIPSIDDVTIDVFYDPVLCRDQAIDNFNVVATGGDGTAFTYTLRESNNGPFHPDSPLTESSSGLGVTFQNLEPGKTYRVGAFYGTCTPEYKDTTIQNPQTFGLIYPMFVDLTCYGGDTSITISASGKAPFEISTDGTNYSSFSSGSNSHTLSNLTHGTYDYYVRDGNGCVYDGGMPITINVIEPDEIQVSLITLNPRVKCFGQSNAEVELQVTGGNAPFSVEVLGSGRLAGNTDLDGYVTFTNLPVGDFDVQITESNLNGCSVTRQNVLNISGPPAPLSLSTNIASPYLLNCFGDSVLVEVDFFDGWTSSSGNFSVKVTGGNNVDLNLLPPSYSAYLKKGTYYIQVEDELNGCIAKDTIIITQLDQVKLENVTPTDVSCFGANDASIAFSVSGGTGSFFWGIDDAPTNPMNTNPFTIDNSVFSLSKGSYNLFVTDENGCNVDSELVPIDEPDPIDFTFAYDTVSCNGVSDATIRILTASGGPSEGSYRSYLTYPDGTEQQKSFPNITGIGAGQYKLRIADNNTGNCSSQLYDLTIAEPEPVVFNPDNFQITHITCFKNPASGSIIVDVDGGFPNAYDLEYKITGPNDMERPYQDSPEFNDLRAGSYNVTARLKNERINENMRCAVTYEGIVVEPAIEIIVASIDVLDVVCHNDRGTIQVNASGGSGDLEYYITNANPDVNNNPNLTGIFDNIMELNQPSTTLEIVVSDRQHNCSVTKEITISNPDKLEMNFVKHIDPTCFPTNDGKIYINVSGGTVEAATDYTFYDHDTGVEFDYEIDNVSGNYVIFNLEGDRSYRPRVYDATNICNVSIQNPVPLIKPQPVVIDNVTLGVKLCWGDMNDRTIIHASGGTERFYYSLNNGDSWQGLTDSIFVGESVGLKYPLVRDENGCLNLNETEPLLLEQPDALEVEYEFIPIMCYDDDFGDMKLEIKGGTGNYYLSINNSNFDGFINEIPRASTDVTEYSLIDNDMGLSEQVTYRFYLRDENNCYVRNIPGVNSFTKQIADTIFQRPEKLVLTSLGQKSVHCRDENTGMIEFEGRGGTVYDYSGYKLTAYNLDRPGTTARSSVHGSKFVDKLFAGAHRVQLVDAHNCIAETRLEEYAFEWDTITVAYANEAIHLSISDIFDPLCDRTYDGAIEINVADYSEDGVTAYVDYWDYSLGKFFRHQRPDTIYSDPDYADNSNPQNLLYYTNAYRVSDFIGIGRYMITVEDNYTGCTASVDTVVYSIDGDDCPDINNYNVFTPHNNDEYYDNWVIHGSQHQKFTLQVYTSYGELVYKNQGISDYEGVKWNGLDNHGRPAPVGTYIYLLRKNEGTPRDTLINGNVTIIRSHGR